MTHIAWSQHFRGGKFRKWVEVGEGRIEVDSTGAATVHVFEDRSVRGDSGYTCLLPVGIRPADPQPQRPDRLPAVEED
jgi:hypothetical protein